MVGVEEEQAAVQRGAAHQEGDAPGQRIAPGLVVHARPVRLQPDHVLDAGPADLLAVHETGPSQGRPGPAHPYQALDEVSEGAIAIGYLVPLEPRQVVVLAVGIVVSRLAAADPVAP